MHVVRFDFDIIRLVLPYVGRNVPRPNDNNVYFFTHNKCNHNQQTVWSQRRLRPQIFITSVYLKSVYTFERNTFYYIRKH